MVKQVIQNGGRLMRRHAAISAVIVLVLVAALPVLAYPLWRDHGMYANIARWAILNGGTPYIDMWDIKPPPIYYLFAGAIALFGSSSAALRALDLVCFPLTAWGLYTLGSRRITPRAGAWAAFFFGIFYFTETYASLTQSDSLVTLPMVWAAVAALRAGDAQGWRALAWAGVAGAISGLVLWFKQYYLFFVLALALLHLLRRRDTRQMRALWREAGAFVAGGCVTAGGLFLYFYSRGMWAEMLIVAQGTAAYNAQGADLGALVDALRHYLLFRWWHWGALLLPAAGGWWLLARRRPDERLAARLIGLWLLAQLAFVLIQAKGFDTHWIPLLPALALLAGHAAAALTERPHGRWIAAGLLVVYTGILLNSTWLRAWPYVTGQETQLAYFARFREGGDVEPAESLQVVEWLRPRLAPGDSLYIWGFRPEVAYLGGWRPPTRYQAQFPVVAPWYPPAWKVDNVKRLWAALPPYVLVLQSDNMPWVTNSHDDSHQLLVQYTDLSNWLGANYERIEQIGDFIIWRRRLS